ncbi:MAG: response regulator transcription factor [Flavobacteriaceae bacterium]|nr:response regulator transcription factor [Flavobacteriaceae bacterium]
MARNFTIKVHLADDHQILIDGIRAVINFQDDIEVLGYSLNGQEVMDWYKTNSSDVLVLDINMPVKDGIQVLRELRYIKHCPKIIVLSSYDDVKLIKEVLKLGVSGFVPKKSAGEFIVEAIREVYEGEQYFTGEIKEKMMQTLLGKPIEERISQEGILAHSLTTREFEILKMIAQQYTTKEISETLFLSESTVDTHRRNLMKKLRVKNSVGLALFALKNGIG